MRAEHENRDFTARQCEHADVRDHAARAFQSADIQRRDHGVDGTQCAWCIIVGVAAAIEYTGTLRAGLLLRTAGQQPYLQQDYTERDCRH